MDVEDNLWAGGGAVEIGKCAFAHMNAETQQILLEETLLCITNYCITQESIYPSKLKSLELV